MAKNIAGREIVRRCDGPAREKFGEKWPAAWVPAAHGREPITVEPNVPTGLRPLVQTSPMRTSDSAFPLFQIRLRDTAASPPLPSPPAIHRAVRRWHPSGH